MVAPRFRTPSEAKTYIAGLDFFMGARMHACIAAFSSGVPVVPMAYSRKFAGLFGTLGYDHTVDCTTEPNEAILAKTAAAFEAAGALAAEAAAALETGPRQARPLRSERCAPCWRPRPSAPTPRGALPSRRDGGRPAGTATGRPGCRHGTGPAPRAPPGTRRPPRPRGSGQGLRFPV